jgi:hypothetical protein
MWGEGDFAFFNQKRWALSSAAERTTGPPRAWKPRDGHWKFLRGNAKAIHMELIHKTKNHENKQNIRVCRHLGRNLVHFRKDDDSLPSGIIFGSVIYPDLRWTDGHADSEF